MIVHFSSSRFPCPTAGGARTGSRLCAHARMPIERQTDPCFPSTLGRESHGEAAEALHGQRARGRDDSSRDGENVDVERVRTGESDRILQRPPLHLQYRLYPKHGGSSLSVDAGVVTGEAVVG